MPAPAGRTAARRWPSGYWRPTACTAAARRWLSSSAAAVSAPRRSPTERLRWVRSSSITRTRASTRRWYWAARRSRTARRTPIPNTSNGTSTTGANASRTRVRNVMSGSPDARDGVPVDAQPRSAMAHQHPAPHVQQRGDPAPPEAGRPRRASVERRARHRDDEPIVASGREAAGQGLREDAHRAAGLRVEGQRHEAVGEVAGDGVALDEDDRRSRSDDRGGSRRRARPRRRGPAPERPGPGAPPPRPPLPGPGPPGPGPGPPPDPGEQH